MRVSIDANTYIKLFEGRPSKDYFEKLENLLTEKKFILVFPRITQEEVYRRVVQILKKEPEEPKLTFPAIPDIFDDQEVIKKLKKIEDEYRKAWTEEYKKQVGIKKDMAKRFFSSFKELAVDYQDLDGEAYKLAVERKDKRFSPGKNSDPLGDQLAWEIILKNCLDQDLIIVSADKDWQEVIGGATSKINPFLLKDWRGKTDRKIVLVENLGDLIKKFEKDYKVPEVESEKEKFMPIPSDYPYIVVSQNAGTPSLLSTPLRGTVVEPISSSLASLASVDLSGTPVIVGSINTKYSKCVECGKDTDMEFFQLCRDCRKKRGIFW